MSELVAFCRLRGDVAAGLVERIRGELVAGDVFCVWCEHAHGEVMVSLSATDWRRLALAKARVAGEIRRAPGCAALALAWEGDGDPERLGHVQRWTVAAVGFPTPMLRRVTFRVEDAAFYRGDVHHVRLLLPPVAGGRLAFPKACPAGLPIWPSGDAMPTLRNYTIRNIRSDTEEVDVDFVIHEPAGPATAWAITCRPGDEVGALGPIGRPVSRAPLRVLAGDETAVPTILRQVEECSPDQCIDAYIEVSSDAEHQAVISGANCRIEWLRRGHLADALRSRGGNGADFAYAGSEFETSRQLAAIMGSDMGLPRTRFRSVAYWRAEQASVA